MKNIIFDLGGVIADLDLHGLMQRMKAMGFPLPETLAESEEPLRSLNDLGPLADLICKMDRGEMPGMDFVQRIQEMCAPGTTLKDVRDAYNNLIVVPRNRIEWIARLRNRYRILLLSNIGDLHWIYFQQECARQGFPVENVFDNIYVSYQLHMAKPEPAIFEHVIRDSGITATETLYIDDSPANIQMGASFGLQTRLIAPNSLVPEEECFQ